MNFLEIIPLTEPLLPAAVDLDRLCFGQLWTLDGYRREINSPNSDLLVIRAIPSVPPLTLQSPTFTPPIPQILGLGCLWAILEEAHITILAIHPDYRSQGLGQALLYQLIQKACQRQLAWVTLEVRVSNAIAIALYAKFGFQEVGRRRHYYQNPTDQTTDEQPSERSSAHEDALILWNNALKEPEFQETLRVWKHHVSDRLAQSNWVLCEG